MAWTNLILISIVGSTSLIIGYLFGARQTRKIKRQAIHDSNRQALELLDTKASLKALKRYVSQQERKDKLLKLSLRKLQQTNAQRQQLQEQMAVQKRRHFTEISHLKLKTVELQASVTQANHITRQSTDQLQYLKQAAPAPQTIQAPELKSYGVGEPVTVSIVDQQRIGSPSNVISPVSNRDSSRLTKLHRRIEARSLRM